jgi:hypothetical protein
VKLRSIGAWHTAPVPAGAKELPADGRIATRCGELVIGAFVDDAEGTNHVMVVNSSIENPADVSLALEQVSAGVDELGRDNGKWRELAAADDGHVANVKLTIAPGDGVLLRLR